MSKRAGRMHHAHADPPCITRPGSPPGSHIYTHPSLHKAAMPSNDAGFRAHRWRCFSRRTEAVSRETVVRTLELICRDCGTKWTLKSKWHTNQEPPRGLQLGGHRS